MKSLRDYIFEVSKDLAKRAFDKAHGAQKNRIRKLYKQVNGEDLTDVDKDKGKDGKFHPKDRHELISLLKKLLDIRGENANLNDVDVSAITDMTGVFYNLRGGWMKGNTVTKGPGNIRIDEWNMSNVTNMDSMFAECHDFNCDISGWDLSNVTNMRYAFFKCWDWDAKGIDKWNLKKVTDLDHAFCMNRNITNENLSGWDVSNCTKFDSTFKGCDNFVGNGLESWNMSKAKSVCGMFAECNKLNFDVSKWDLRKCRDIRQVFANCGNMNLKPLEKWDISNAWYIDSLFWGQHDLELDLSGWDTSNVRTMYALFHFCKNLNVKGLDKWNLSKLRNMDEIFSYTEVNKDCDLRSQINKWEFPDNVSMKQAFYNIKGMDYYPYWYKKR